MSELVEKTENFVEDLFQNELPKTCIYHNHAHTRRVFKSTKEIADNVSISDEDKELLLLTALLHDTGYTKSFENHEEYSVNIAKEFLKSNHVAPNKIQEVSRLIMATKMTHTPQDLLEQIIRDADASHFAKEYYNETSELLREEFKIHGINDFDSSGWLKSNIELFQNHHSYYTDYAKTKWKPKKEENLAKMLQEQKRQKKAEKVKKAELKKLLKEESPEKGVQTAFRVTLRNHLKLSDIADTKANILLSVNAIIISLALSNLIPKLDNPSNTYLIYPTLIFLVFSIASMILSVLATRPNVTSGEFTRKEIEEKKVNLLFFGNFHKMPLDEYRWAMNELMKDKEYIYDTMIKDLYFLGKVLHRKYKILRITYTVFIIGITVSVLSFIIAFNTLQ
ncbi:Pycsar system effector family protein [Aquimarina brevivitae]|uniref:Putative metal-dependent HD superfamily phosphohydrolase n=1 Tax=Aquimarina brevivitae TaxID=323412 RepID=A0A4Q7NTL0_9FLAO|nr:Pycsar system effector family protein [Aquimarina brevivitae]RZS90516.1 putative metal-dependent HD superfamily phosphohydrolase [Aquimarina brevivitae]